MLNFEPQLGMLPNALNDLPSKKRWLKNLLKYKINSSLLKIYDYKEVKSLFARREFSYKYLPCIMVGWDNTARRGEKGVVFVNQNKQAFKESLILASKTVEEYLPEEKLIFINAWNEWAEGNYLEPCAKFGFQYLEAVKEVFGSRNDYMSNKK